MKEPVFGPGLWPFVVLFCIAVAIAHLKGAYYGKHYADDPQCQKPHNFPICRPD